MNCVGAMKAAKDLGPGKVILTFICDSGQRHLTKFWNSDYLEKFGLTPQFDGESLAFIEY